MKLDVLLKKILTNKILLNVVFAVAFVNFICFIICGKEHEAILFVLMAYLTSCFSGNMIIVLSVPIVLVNLISLSNGVVEGMENDTDNVTTDASNIEIDGSGNNTSYKKDEKKEEVSKKKNEIDYASTVEEAYENIGNILGGDGMKKLGGDTQHLADQQKALMKSIEGIEPMVENIGPLMAKMGTMIESLGGADGMSKFANIASAFGKNAGNDKKEQ
tara:strand:- start:856 stop:1506 length:651 start_codon:yes stop_codon:yes gene_type:complete